MAELTDLDRPALRGRRLEQDELQDGLHDERFEGDAWLIQWQDPCGSSGLGRLRLDERGLWLEAELDEGAWRELPYATITSAQLERGAEPALAVECDEGRWLFALAEAEDVLHELRERLLPRPRSGKLAVAVPLRRGSAARAQALVALGPPFDPEASGLISHQVLLFDDLVVFLFEAQDRAALKAVASGPELWAAAEGWREIVVGGPRLAEEVYQWQASGRGEL